MVAIQPRKCPPCELDVVAMHPRKVLGFVIIVFCSCLTYLVISGRLWNYEGVGGSGGSAFFDQLIAFVRSSSNETEKPPPITILTWTTFFGRPMENDYLNGCPFRNVCSITTDKSEHAQAHALVFHSRDMQMRRLPSTRSAGQLYVFLSHESPPNTDAKAYTMSDFFNWTMTYRMDSDVPYPYSYMVKEEPPSPLVDLDATILGPKRSINRTKSSLIAWFVSNCYTHSKREQYVEALRRHIAVDIYGRCGTNSCPRSSSSECDRLIDEQYKFYLAFENSLCSDYVSEKFWARTHWNAVPIVLKRVDVERLFPRRSFIAASDFANPQLLASYLDYLHSNDSAYLEYFQWRNEGYRFRTYDERGMYFGFCGLCQRLIKGGHESKSYRDLRSWWVAGSRCDQDLVSNLLREG